MSWPMSRPVRVYHGDEKTPRIEAADQTYHRHGSVVHRNHHPRTIHRDPTDEEWMSGAPELIAVHHPNPERAYYPHWHGDPDGPEPDDVPPDPEPPEEEGTE